VWKSAVCVAYRGKPIAVCMTMADAAVLADDPGFVPVYDAALLEEI
jgi:hypothetical protein